MNQSEKDNSKPIHQFSIESPFFSYIIISAIFFFIHSFLFPFHSQAFTSYTIYSFTAPLIIVWFSQNKVPFYLYATTGFLLSSMIQILLYPNVRYVVSNGIMGATIWSVVFLLTNWFIRSKSIINRTIFIEKNHLKHKKDEPSVSDMLLHRGQIGYYLTLDTVVGPGLSTRRGYTRFGGGPECGAPPHTIMTYPDYIPNIPCKSK